MEHNVVKEGHVVGQGQQVAASSNLAMGIPVMATAPSQVEAGMRHVQISSSVFTNAIASDHLYTTGGHHEMIETTTVAVLQLEQCCVCSVFFELPKKPIPQPDLNRMMCQLLDVTPDPTFFRTYVAICVNCSNLLRKFDRLRVELEFVRTQVVTYVVESITQIRPEGGTGIDCVRNQILKRWTNAGRESKNRKSAPGSSTAPSINSKQPAGLAWTTANNLVRNTAVIGAAKILSVGSEGTGNSNASKPVASQPDFDYDHNDGDAEFVHASDNDGGDSISNGEDAEDFDNSVADDNNDNSNYSNAAIESLKRDVPAAQPPGAKKKRIRNKQPYKPRPKEVAPLICTICGRIFARSYNYNAHTQACTTDILGMEKNCTICSEVLSQPTIFETWEEFKAHVYSYHPVIDLEHCTFCKCRFLPNGVKSHKCSALFKSTMDTEAIFKCDRCDRAYNSRANLTDHVRRCHKDQKHTCEICKKTYGSPMLLKLHVERHTRVVSKFQCQHCGVCLSNRYSLNQHTRIHSREGTIECKTCGKKFVSKTIYKNHQMVHSNIKPHVCHICGTGFKLKGTLSRHILRHKVKETNYTKRCPLCPKAIFRKIWVLKKHMELEHPQAPETLETLEKYKDINDMPRGKDIKYESRPGVGRVSTSKSNLKARMETFESEEEEEEEYENESEKEMDYKQEPSDVSSESDSELPIPSSFAPSRQSNRIRDKAKSGVKNKKYADYAE